MIPSRTLFAAVMLATTVAVGGDYQLKTPKILPVEAYPARSTSGGITVAADPYPTDEKSFTAFDVHDLNSRGYFPVLVVIQNSSPNPVSIRTREIVLATAKGQEIYSHPATLVVQDVVKAGLRTKIPKMRGEDRATSTKSGSPLMDFTGKELTSRAVEPGTVANGFLFFYTAEPKKNLFAGSTLRIPKIVDEATRATLGPFALRLDAALAATGQQK